MKDGFKYIAEYWSQITLLLLGVGYLFKLYLNYLTRKSEINHSLFQKTMIESVLGFIHSYSTSEELWRDLPLLRISKKEFTAKEMDLMIFPHLNDIKNKSLQLRIFFGEKEMEPFDGIVSNLFKVNSKVSEIYHNPKNLDKNYTSESWEYEKVMDEMIEKNRELILQITNMIRTKFK